MSATFRDRKKFATVHGKQMAYIEEGEGDPIVFLHGNPTSSYLWRNIMPYLAGKGRLIAPDLIGMGDSEKLDDSGPGSYSYVEQRKYLFALLEQLGVSRNVTLVIHDWGSGLGFHWAHTHPDAVRGIAFMEAIVAPLPSWELFPASSRSLFQAFRSPAGEDLVLNNNIFVEKVLPASILRELSDEEMTEYRRPFAKAGEDRRPTLTWPQQIPVAGEPADVFDIVSAYSRWLTETTIPKLFINAEPGVLISGGVRDFVRSWPNITETTVPGLHFIQEDSPEQIGEALRDWHANL